MKNDVKDIWLFQVMILYLQTKAQVYGDIPLQVYDFRFLVIG